MADRPKLEIVTGDDGIAQFYINGAYVADTDDTPLTVAQHVARALGADVDETDDPMPQPYVYFIAYNWMSAHDNGCGQVWHTRTTPIEDAESLEASRQRIKADNPERGEIVIVNFIYVDGPS